MKTRDSHVPDVDETVRRDQVLSTIRRLIEENRPIPFDPAAGGPYTGKVGVYQYCFEGEDDLLHLIIERSDGSPLVEGETLLAAQFLLPGVPDAMIWLRPGVKAHHYYLGHDLLFCEPSAEL